jgi:hypothetical protein
MQFVDGCAQLVESVIAGLQPNDSPFGGELIRVSSHKLQQKAIVSQRIGCIQLQFRFP